MPGREANPFIAAGRFNLVKRLGSGSFGEIYLAIDLKTGQVIHIHTQKFDHTEVLNLHHHA